jgi:hypothetical protein
VPKAALAVGIGAIEAQESSLYSSAKAGLISLRDRIRAEIRMTANKTSLPMLILVQVLSNFKYKRFCSGFLTKVQFLVKVY